MKASKLILLLPLFFLMACSAAYEQVKEMDIKNPKTFQQHLFYNYKINASFEILNNMGSLRTPPYWLQRITYLALIGDILVASLVIT